MKNTERNQETVKELNQLLADYQIFYQNLRGLHWNVRGRLFFSLHGMYEKLYTEAADVIDEIAERILMLDGTPLHTFADYLETAKLEAVTNVADGDKGVQITLENTQYLLNKFRAILTLVSDNGDEGTAALISDLIVAAEKREWMLKATLNK